MESNYIYGLLEKYWSCETSIEEEKVLRHFFSSDDVPNELAAYKAWFMETQQRIAPLDSAFDEKILSQLSIAKTHATPRRRIVIHRWLQIAAVFVIALTCTFLIYDHQTKQQNISIALLEDTFDNPEEALTAVRNAMHAVSTEIDRGLTISAKGFNASAKGLQKTALILEFINNN